MGFFGRMIAGLGVVQAVELYEAGYNALPSGSFVRPGDTNAYAVGDLIANSTTANQVVPITVPISRRQGGTGYIRRVRLLKTGTSITNASFRVHIFRTAPSVITNGDNGAFSTNGAAGYMGAFDITMDQSFTDGARGNGGPRVGTEITFDLPGTQTDVYILLEARGAYTPIGGETFTVEVEVIQN